MNLTPEQIKSNWDALIEVINNYISEPRKSKLLDFYTQYETRLSIMPASHKIQYHNCFAGGYVDHLLRVITAALKIEKTWEELGVEKNYTIEELVFSALNHDLGKMGDKDNAAYIPNTSQWHVENRGELYEFNHKIPYMSVPDRSLFLLTQHGIEYSENEFLSIKLHDGIYDEANKPYLMNFLPEQKPRTSLVFIIQQADMLASRIEFEKEWLPKFAKEKEVKEVKKKIYKKDISDNYFKNKAKTSEGLTTVMNEFFK